MSDSHSSATRVMPRRSVMTTEPRTQARMTGDPIPMISARRVRKSFGEHRVLDDVDLTVWEGTIFSLFGPTGRARPRWCASFQP
jgi:ABC-type glutathione transport system ATPase component